MNTKTERVGPIQLAPGVTTRDFWVFLIVASVSIGFLVFINVIQPYVLGENLGIETARQGTVTGDLAFWAEVVSIFCFGFVGALADKWGRRPMIFFGLLVMAAGYGLYPMAADLYALLLYRLIFAVGAAMFTGGLFILLQDIPQETSRGKLMAAVSVTQTIGAGVSVYLFSQLLPYFKTTGFSVVMAGRLTHWVVAFFVAATAIFLSFGLSSSQQTKLAKQNESIWSAMLDGLRLARKPRIRLAYLAGFVGRADMAVAGLFIALWGALAGREMAIDSAVATERSGILVAIVLGCSVLTAPLVGFIADRVNRVAFLIAVLVIGTIGYSAVIFVDNPLDWSNLGYFLLLGIGQGSAFFGSGLLIGQEAPAKKRGAVIGVYSLCGAAGILLITALGGRLFDMFSPKAPFILMALLYCILLLGTIFVYITDRGPSISSMR